MKRPERQSDGQYHISGRTYKNLIGSRQQVWNRTTYKTEGQLHRSDLIMNKWGRIVSKNKHNTAKKEKDFKNMDILQRRESSDLLKDRVVNHLTQKINSQNSWNPQKL